MAMEIFKLVGSIFVDSDKANESLSKTDKKASGIGTTLMNGIKTAGKWAAGLTAAAGTVATGLIAVTNSSLEALDNIDKMSQKIGISAEAYQEWSYVLGQNGMDVDKLQTGVKTLVTQMDAAANGNKKASEAFATLGLSVTDASGSMKSQEQMMRETLYALADMEDGTEKAKLAYELFGKSGSELMPMLNQGSASMQELTDRAHELGLVMNGETVSAGVVLGDTIDDIKKSFSSLGTKLGASLIPIVQRFADYIVANLPRIQTLFDQLTPIFIMLFETLMPPLMNLAEQLLPVVIELISTLAPIFSEICQKVLPVAVELLNMILPLLTDIISQLLPPLIELLVPLLDLLSPLIELLQPIFDLITMIITPIKDLIEKLLTPLITLVSTLVVIALNPLKNSLDNVAKTVSGVFSDAINTIVSVFENAKQIFSGLIDFISGIFTGNWKKAWSGVQDIFSGIWENIKSAFKLPINWIIEGINSFIRGINKIKIPDWVPAVGGKGFSIKEIPKLAYGGVLEKGQTGLLEGTGAEAVVPLENNRKWIRAVADDMQSAGLGDGEETITLLKRIVSLLEELKKLGIYLDKDTLVGILAGPIDRELGRLAMQKARA